MRKSVTWKKDMALLGLVVALFFCAFLLDKPPERSTAAIAGATVAAAQEYERVLERCGDSSAAMEASDSVFEEVLEEWRP